MSFEDIRIYRDIPVINNYLALPPNREQDKNDFYCGGDCGAEAQALVEGSDISRFGSSSETGSKHGRQRWLRLPYITPNTWYTSDPVDNLSSNTFDGTLDVQS